MALYLRAYFRARALAVEGPPAGVAVLDSAADAPSVLPLIVLALGIIGGTFAISYAAMHYHELPARVPTHFGPSGRPDAWRPKSFWTVMLLPLFTLIMGVGMAGMAFLVARAKRAIRFPQTQISVEAQRRFRQAMTRYLSFMAVVVTGMLMMMSIDSIRVGLGRAEGLSPAAMVLGIGVAVLARDLCGLFHLPLWAGRSAAGAGCRQRPAHGRPRRQPALGARRLLRQPGRPVHFRGDAVSVSGTRSISAIGKPWRSLSLSSARSW